MLVAQSRPRNLRWIHAGPLLYGDWGTSRLYVLGLAFFYTAHASAFYLAVMGLVMAAVAWAYVIICRSFPDGGGTYAAARRLSPTLAVVGATLLICDYIVTAALSSLEAFKYFGVPEGEWLIALSIGAIVLIGVVNWFGARNAGRVALVVAIASLVCFALIAIVALPYIPRGLETLSTGDASVASPWRRWESLVRIILALSGIEAVANMTGLMRPPVERTAKRTIWPVLAEVAVLNVVFGLALAGLPALHDAKQPDYITHVVPTGDEARVPLEVKEYRDTGMRVLATEAGRNALGDSAGIAFGRGTAIIFGLLLLSATNTAVMAIVAVCYSMAQDRELPRPLTKLNYSGVPKYGLCLAVAVSAAVLAFERDVMRLAELYAVGVVGAITISVGATAANRELTLRRWERACLWALAGFMATVELTIVVAKPNAAVFAGGVIGTVLAARGLVRVHRRRAPEPLPEPETGWLAEVHRGPIKLQPGRPRIMLAARGRQQSEFAVDLARRRGATLFAIYVRTLRVIDVQPGKVPRVEDDPDAQEALGTTAILARRVGVPFIPIYVTSPDIAEEILDYTVTYGCDTLIMGKTRRSVLSRTLTGDVVSRVALMLPPDVTLVTRAASPFAPPEEERRPPDAEPSAGDSSPPPT